MRNADIDERNSAVAHPFEVAVNFARRHSGLAQGRGRLLGPCQQQAVPETLLHKIKKACNERCKPLIFEQILVGSASFEFGAFASQRI
jgi:hypothetical protein